ncbi:MAG: phosphopantothenoylcysteine decarboxylase [Gemmataceae bacterium]
MNILVTAGNTLTMIDQVRAITNIFTGRTGARIALTCQQRGHAVALLTSHPEVVAELTDTPPTRCWQVQTYRTFEDLRQRMEQSIRSDDFDAVIHCAAVSDFRCAGVYAPAEHTYFEADDGSWRSRDDQPPALQDRAKGKVKSDIPELWLRLLPTPKLIDFIRQPWGFTGILVKFKLEVGVSERQLQVIAERSLRQSQADLIVANTLEGARTWALLGPARRNTYQKVPRHDLADRLLDQVERLHQERPRG